MTEKEFDKFTVVADAQWEKFLESLVENGLYWSQERGQGQIRESKTDEIVWEY